MVQRIAVLVLFLSLVSFTTPPTVRETSKLPYKSAGLTEAQAAAHLLSRFTFGATPGQVEAVTKVGLEKWLNQQLDGDEKDGRLDASLADYDTQHLSNAQITKVYVRNGQAFRMAIKDGFIPKDSVDKSDRKEYQEVLQQYMDKNGLKPEKELVRQTVNQKILRAAYSENQLREVLTDFWFNHFNVSFTKNDCSLFIPAYERDVIRPNVLGNFEKLLLATAQSPAMLLYLDNASSTGMNSMQLQREAKRKPAAKVFPTDRPTRKPNKPAERTLKKPKGLNENYAREVMELHTLGVDGGYSQNDVTEVARVLTGWTLKEGEFLFAPNRHDDGEKTVLGKRYNPGGGYDEGVDLLKTLAHHTSTSKFITKKLAVRFVSDNPPQSLLDKMSASFVKENGNIRKVIETMVASKEFWEPAALREKTKSPFELTISSIRALNADVQQPFQLANWLNKMGQRIYYYQAPTGFPDKASYWINTGSLLNRMNFGLALSTQKIPGVKFDLLALNNNHEPESAVDALKTYSSIMLPERDLDQTIERLTPLLNDPDLQKKVDDAARKAPAVSNRQDKAEDEMDSIHKAPVHKKDNKSQYQLSQVIGIIIGSPEFQRR